MIKVLFVCLGNICRSPSAEGVFRCKLQESGLTEHVVADSAGTHAYHVGEPPDTRAQAAAARRGIDLTTLRGRQVTSEDIVEFDYVLAMDSDNLRNLRAITPPQHADKPRLLMEYAVNWKAGDVPDPYFGGATGFERVLDMLEDACDGLLREIRERI